MSKETEINLDERAIYEVHVWRRKSHEWITDQEHDKKFREIAVAILKIEGVTAVQVSDETGRGKLLFNQ
jgi:hypothetical protein